MKNFEEMYNYSMNLYKSIDKSRYFSATHEEIDRGLTSDIYFIRTSYLLEKVGKVDTFVCAEVFANDYGVFAGLAEVLYLLRDKRVRVEALEEGDSFSPKEVVLRIEGSYREFGYLETSILGFLASSSNWATAARLCKEAANGKRVICFGARFVHPACAPVMERAALIGGVDDVSCILGASLANREPRGTIPHAFIIILGDTLEAARIFDKYIEDHVPRIILVDTFKDEVEESIRIARFFREMGKQLYGVRLDTPKERGRVTPELVMELREKLRLEGFDNVKIVVSGGLDPERIATLEKAGADIFGVGSFIASYNKIQFTMDIKEVENRKISKRGRIPGKTDNPRLKVFKEL
ncbi:MAG: nicotinate phosphoribosyltransferase [Candidatus Calescibacterium sp.]|nr:nicotinate phosphoribosyltransferase [Candidatus Calescibacterium sp.]MCX7972692.1 nicotinate phosphoribosyltransferase [bacterium]MDW8194711.1 nicotinate phosphoribosyltransferase [Candidatus Calescibacterium sp.]